jgi:PAS domain S-box-containing protein
LRCKPLLDPSGKVEALLQVSREITDRKKVEEQLRLKEERLEIALEGGEFGTWDWEIPSGNLRLSHRSITMLDYAPEELVSHIDHWKERLHPEDLPGVRRALQEHLDGKTAIYQSEHRLLTQAGEWRWILHRGKVVDRDATGAPARMAGTQFDITSAKVAAEQLRREKELLSLILASIVSGVISVDAQRRITLINPPAQLLTGWSASEAKGCELDQVLQIVNEGGEPKGHPLDGVFDSGPAQRVVRSLEERVLLRGRTGSVHPVMLSAAAMHNADGAFCGAVVAFHDLAKELEAERSKRDFVSTISHELRTPLTSICGFLATLLREPEMPLETRLEFLYIAQEQSSRLQRLVNDILEISRVESGRVKLLRDPILLNSVIEKSIREMLPQAEKRKQRLEVQIPSIPLRIRGDFEKLQSIFTNLLDNAIKFTPEGGNILLMASAEENEAVVNIADTGIGIPERDLPSIFEKFYRVQRPGVHIPGTGLGLAIVQKIVAMHGGRVDVESIPNEGSRFTVRLPLSGSPEASEFAVGRQLGN